ncbi:late competence development ComFB family protein [Clostridium sp. OS1-26]|uniref:late competence development ComFB family protein n=1 Tax=Clostridium sp. OS1-26 TaxID=3070681 RepID=UPI0027E1E744|nr:late competence development ComFB family protein [Clostridium sp. OS1-26]WML37305.1 late competence development ComFB family protein [Clostridium sp. OS1-26]
MLKNYMEVVVDHLIPDILKRYNNICKCELCVEDIKAVALNNLKPMYIVTEKGNIYAKVNELKSQFMTDAITELVRAIEIVSKKPRHSV